MTNPDVTTAIAGVDETPPLEAVVIDLTSVCARMDTLRRDMQEHITNITGDHFEDDVEKIERPIPQGRLPALRHMMDETVEALRALENVAASLPRL